MRNEQPPRGRQILGITTPLPPPVREKELAPPTPEETRAANKGGFAGSTRTVERVGRNKGLKILGALAATVGAGAIAHQAYENVPAVHRAVDSAFLDHIKGKSLSSDTSIPEVFDPTADKQTIKVGVNAVPVTQQEVPSLLKNSIKPVEKGEYPKVSIFLPIEMDTNQIITTETLATKGDFNPFTGKPNTDRHAYGKEFAIPNKGTSIIVSVENAEIFRLTDWKPTPTASPHFMGAVVRFKGPDGAIYYLDIHSADNDLDQVIPDDILDNAPITGENGLFFWNTPLPDSQKGLPLPFGTNILYTSKPNAKVDAVLFTSSPNLPRRVKSIIDLITKDGKVAVKISP